MPYTRWLFALTRPASRPWSQLAQEAREATGSPPVELWRPQRVQQASLSVAIRHIDVGSCGAPEAEIALLSSPGYDISRFGLSLLASPRHADLLLVTGALTEAMAPVLRETYQAMPEPRRVVACGGRPDAGCPFGPSAEAVDRVVPVDVVVYGCPPNPAALLAGLLVAAGQRLPGLGALVRQRATPAAAS